MADEPISDIQAGYDRVAEEYATRIFHELDHKPIDRELLDRFAARTREIGLVCDLGCGPGQVACYLQGQGVPVIGVDASTGMIEVARKLNPGIEFFQGDIRSLDSEDQAWGGVAAFYSILHIPRAEVVTALLEIRRVLRPGGWILLSFHIGDDLLHRDEWWGHEVSIDFHFFRPDEMQAYLHEAGFPVVEIVEREPYPDVEYPTRRAYLFAEKPR